MEIPAVLAPAAEDISRFHIAMYNSMQSEIRETMNYKQQIMTITIITIISSILFINSSDQATR